jgi:hypothetical protein
MLPDEEGVETSVAQAQEIAVGRQTRLRHRDAIVGNELNKFQRGFKAHLECAQVAIVDPDHAGFGGESAVEFDTGVHLDEQLQAPSIR